MNNFEAFGNVFGQTPKKRVNPLFNAKPIVVTLPENKKQEKEEIKEEPKAEEIQAVAETTTTEPEEEKEVKTEEPNSQEEVKQETEPETDSEEEHPDEEESDNDDEDDQEEEDKSEENTTVEVEKPKKRRRRRTKAEIEAAKQEEAKEETDKSVAEDVEVKKDKKEAPAEIKTSKQAAAPENVKVTSGTFKFENVIDKFVPVVEDSKWDEQVKYIDEQMDKIKFDSDINAGTIRVMLPLIDNLYNYIKKIKPEYETLCEQLISDSVGLIPRQKLANSTGSNSEERKKNGSMACENFKVETLRGTLNLYEFYGIALSRLNYLKAKIDSLESSKSALIGFLTVITKAEK